MSELNMDFMSELEADIELIKQKVSLEEKYKEEVEFYKNMLMQQRNSCDDSDFLIMSTEFDEDSIDIIGQHIRQIGEIVYENGFLLATRQECDRNYGIYLRQLHDHVDMAKTVKIIEQFVEEKRENFVKTRDWPVDMVAPQFQYVTFLVENEKKLLEEQANRHSEALNEKIREMKRDISRVIDESKRYRQKTQEYEQKIKEMEENEKDMKMNGDNIIVENKKLQEKVVDCDRIIKDKEHQIEKYLKKTQELERKIEEQAKKLEENEQKFKKREEEQIAQIKQLIFNPHSSSKPGLRLFLQDENFTIIKYFTVVLDEIGYRLFKREEGDYDRCEPPLKEINSQERRRREVIDYIKFIIINWNNPYSGTVIQNKIHEWFYFNNKQFKYNPSEEEKEKSRKMFLNKFKLENTIGTIHFLPIHYKQHKYYFSFAISNYKIVNRSSDRSQQSAYSNLYYTLKELPTWTENSKFATEMEVNDEQSDIFIHTSNKDVFVENEKVVTWMKNNFNIGQYNNSNSDQYLLIIPTLYNIIVNSTILR